MWHLLPILLKDLSQAAYNSNVVYQLYSEGLWENVKLKSYNLNSRQLITRLAAQFQGRDIATSVFQVFHLLV
ncbi:MAG: hypothetical protein ACQEP8_06580, partial [Chlamydiota bacterium]